MDPPEEPHLPSTIHAQQLFFIETSQEGAGRLDAKSRHLVRAQARRSASHIEPWTLQERRQRNSGSPQAFKSKFKLASWQRPRRSNKQTNDCHQDIPIPSLSPAQLAAVNTLPIPMSLPTQRILQFCHAGFRTNKFSLNPRGDWMSIATADAGLLNAFLSTAAVLRNLHLRINDLDAVVHHRQEAIRLINQRLTVEPGTLSQQVVAAVAVLVAAEALDDNFSTALIHMRGLSKMVDICGGLASFDHSPTLQRVIIWADFSFSVTWGTPLSFPLVQSLSHPLLRSHILKTETASQQTTSSPSNHPDPKTLLLDTLTILQSVSQQITKFPFTGGDPTAIGNTIYVVEYRLLTLIFSEIGIGYDVNEPFYVAALLYSILAIRDFPLQAPRHRELIDRLSACLSRWRELSSLSIGSGLNQCIRLWVLFMGATVSKDSATRALALQGISEINSVLGIVEYEDFESNLKRVLWMDSFCRQHCLRLWNDLESSLSFDSA